MLCIRMYNMYIHTVHRHLQFPFLGILHQTSLFASSLALIVCKTICIEADPRFEKHRLEKKLNIITFSKVYHR